MAKHPKSTREDFRHKVKKLSLSSRLDKSLIRTVDDFVVNSRSHVAPFFSPLRGIDSSVPGSSDYYSGCNGDSSSDESAPPLSTRLGINPPPCFLLSQSSDEDRGESDREVHKNLKLYLPTSTRSFISDLEKVPDKGKLSFSLKGSYIIAGLDQVEIGEPLHEDLEASSPASCVVESNKDFNHINKEPISPTQLSTPKTYHRSPKAKEVDENTLPFSPVQIIADQNDEKVSTGAWSESEVVFTGYGDEKRDSITKTIDVQDQNWPHSPSGDWSSAIQRSTSQNTYANPQLLTIPSMQTLRGGKSLEEAPPLALEPFISEDGANSAGSEESCMLSLFNNPDWVKVRMLE
jgi:hypothetical protein